VRVRLFGYIKRSKKSFVWKSEVRKLSDIKTCFRDIKTGISTGFMWLSI